MRRVEKFLCVVAIWVTLGQATYAQSSPFALQQEAEAALVTGDAERAAALSQELLQSAPDSFAGAFLLALALDELGEHRGAAKAAARAYRVAPTQGDKLRAAQLAGTAWFKAAAFTRSEFWLRRAANHIQTEEEARAVVLAFQQSQDANPLSFQISGWAAPSDNINNGAEDEIFRLEDVPIDFFLPPERLALSGIEYAAEAQIAYRLSQSEKQRTSIGAYAFGRTFTFSDESQDLLPDASGHDFAFGIADLSLIHERQIFETLGPSSISANIGRVWYGGDPIWDYRTWTVQQGFALTGAETLTLRAATTYQKPLFSGASDVNSTDISATLKTTLPNDDSLQLNFARTYSNGGFENVFSEYRIGTNYDIAQPLWNTLWSWSVTLGYRSYDTFPTTLDGRRDTFGSAGLDVVFQDVSYWGFSPKLSLNATRTVSSAEEFNSRGLQGRFALQSNF